MKSLYLLRHAKSSWAEAGVDDFDRPLSERGRKAAPRIGRHLHRAGIEPDLVLCSSALRARETWEAVASELGEKPPVEYHRSLYLASPSRLLSTLHQCGGGIGSLLLVGHNPGIEELAGFLAGPRSEPKVLAALRQKYPTGALAVFELELTSWRELAEGGARLCAFVRPRDL